MIDTKKKLGKQILSIALCLLLTLTCIPIRASATEIQEQGVNTVSGNDVNTVSGNDAAYTVSEALSVTITWTSMEFTYSYGTWNPETLLYDGEGGWHPAEGCGQITVENTGEEAVTAIFTYTPERTEISGSFTYKDANVTDVSIAANESITVSLNLSGEPSEELQNEALGKVTVTFSSSADN